MRSGTHAVRNTNVLVAPQQALSARTVAGRPPQPSLLIVVDIDSTARFFYRYRLRDASEASALANPEFQEKAKQQALPLAYHDTHIVGVTVSRVMNDVAVINDLLSQGLVTLIGDLLVLVGIIIGWILGSRAAADATTGAGSAISGGGPTGGASARGTTRPEAMNEFSTR